MTTAVQLPPAVPAPDAAPTRRRPYLSIRARRGWISINWRELWLFRDLLASLTARDIKLRYKQTALGITWVLLQPLVASAILVYVFGKLAKMAPDNTMYGQHIPYFLYMYASIVLWNLFANIVSKVSGILVGNSTLVSKVYFPRLLLPMSAAMGALLDLGVAGCVLVILQVWAGVPFGPQVLLTPIILLLVMSAALGIGIWAAALCVQYRDVGYIVPVAVQFLFLASPIAYSISVVHGKAGAFIFQLNPLSGMIGLWRWAVLGTPFPEAWTVWSAAGISIGLLLVGAMVFRRMERTFADVIQRSGSFRARRQQALHAGA